MDFDAFCFKKGSYKIDDIAGVEVVVKPKRRIDSRFQSIEEYREWSRDILEKILYRCAQELLFWRNIIEFS